MESWDLMISIEIKEHDFRLRHLNAAFWNMCISEEKVGVHIHTYTSNGVLKIKRILTGIALIIILF